MGRQEGLPSAGGECPTYDELRGFSNGEAPTKTIELVADHLVECHSCAARVEKLLAEDELAAALRAENPLPVDMKKLHDFVGRLHRLGEPVSPEASTMDALCTAQPTATPNESGNLLAGRYRLDEALGTGAFGEVWRARDLELEQDVAVKLVRHDRRSAGLVEALRGEARRQAALRKVPGIVTLYDVGESFGQVYLVGEYVAGGTLKDRLPELSRDERVDIVTNVARALQQAHKLGLVHRDIKPANILLESDGRPVLTDFGISATQREMVSEPEHMIVGTYAYMAPEQVHGRANRADPRTDVYSLGVVLYECLVGERPFADYEGDAESLRHAILTRDPWSPRSKDESVSSEFERVCSECLGKEPEDRYSSMGDMVSRLQQARGITRRRGLAIGLGAAAVAVSGIVAAQLPRTRSPESVPPDPTLVVRPQPTAGITPRAILRSRASLDDLLHVNEITNSIQISSTDLFLVGLGRVGAGDLRLSVTIRSHVLGGAGLFYSYRERRDGTRHQFELLRLVLQDSSPCSHRSANVFHPDSPDSRDSVEFRPRCLERHRDENVVAVLFEGGVLQMVAWNGQVVEEVEPYPFDAEVNDHTGLFGLFTDESHAVFSDIQIDGAAVALNQP